MRSLCVQRRRSEGARNGSGAQNGADSSSDEEKEAAECEDDDETVEVCLRDILSHFYFNNLCHFQMVFLIIRQFISCGFT